MTTNWTVVAMEQKERERGLKRARAVAQWHLGDPKWADEILLAFYGETEVSRNAEAEIEGKP